MDISEGITKVKITECPDQPKNLTENEGDDQNIFRDATDHLAPDNNLSDDDYGSCRSRSSSCSADLEDCREDGQQSECSDSAVEDEEQVSRPSENEEIHEEFDETYLKELEEQMSDEEKESHKLEALKLKEEGNRLFGSKDYKSAIESYSLALKTCPISFTKDRAMMYSNRAAAKVYLEQDDAAIRDCCKAIEFYPEYVKALLRRAQLYEKKEKLDEALEDYQKVVQFDPSQGNAVVACKRLPLQIQERNEKLKAEMMGKLKDLGNCVLKPFGLSTDNFSMQQDPNTGSYSIQFNQKPQPNS